MIRAKRNKTTKRLVYIYIDLAKNRLDWSPSIALKEGLGNTINYFKEKLQWTSKYNKRGNGENTRLSLLQRIRYY